MKVLVLIAYSEYQENKTINLNAIDNIIYFLKNGLINNTNYKYIINCSGKYSINFNEYINKYKNLSILNIKGNNAYESWLNILNNVDITLFDYYLFMKDKVRGPYYQKDNWINFMIRNIGDNCLISGYGTSPFGKLTKFPFIPDKFFMISQRILKILINHDFLKKNIYKLDFNSNPKNHNHNTLVEIKLSKLLLDHNINYVTLDTQGVLDLDILKYYREKNWEKLFEITKKLHQVNDTTIEKRLFWTGTTMKKIFEDKNEEFIRKLQIPRDISQLEKW